MEFRLDALVPEAVPAAASRNDSARYTPALVSG